MSTSVSLLGGEQLLSHTPVCTGVFWLICVGKELGKKTKKKTNKKTRLRAGEVCPLHGAFNVPCGWVTYTRCVHVLYTTLCHSCVSDLDSSHITRLKFVHFGGQLLSVSGYLHHFSPQGWEYERKTFGFINVTAMSGTACSLDSHPSQPTVVTLMLSWVVTL